MKALAGTDPPPKSTNLAEWQEVVAKRRLGEFSLEAITAAFLDLGPNADRSIRHDLARYISDEIYTRLRRNVGRNHPNEGNDIIDRVHFQLFEALARPQSKDAKGMRVAFASRVMFRLKDAIAVEARAQRVPDETATKENKKSKNDKTLKKDGETILHVEISKHPDLIQEVISDDLEFVGGSGIQRDPTLMAGVCDTDENFDVNRFLMENIPDYKKRLAFRLFMEDVPYKSKKANSIAEALDIDEKTARLWIEEVQGELRTKIGEKS
ncbi:MAG TPA: hypothetical protein VJQ48_10075 [Candidatus Binatia bacterium]|nr:hypothetical protein [Candidatus Binatia bacterium]